MYINEISNRTAHHIVFAIVTHHVSFCSIVNLFANGIDASIDITKKCRILLIIPLLWCHKKLWYLPRTLMYNNLLPDSDCLPGNRST